jgi:TniQ
MVLRTVPRLFRRLPLHPDESVVSLVQRHCQANHVPRMLDMLRLISRLTGEPADDVRDLVESRKALNAIEGLVGLAAGTLDSHYLAPIEKTHLRAGHHDWVLGLRRGAAQAVCPACLSETGYARTAWSFVQAPVCLVHGIALLEACPACSKPLRHRRTRLLNCGECGLSLSDAPRQPISDVAKVVAGLVQRPCMVPMGDQETTSPIDQRDLSILLRLCLPSGLGRSTSYGLTEAMTSLSIAERISSLTRLGGSMTERRIDSARLRTVILERWVSSGLLPASAQVNLLKVAAATAELPGDVIRLLCQGCDERWDLPAAAQFAGRPPRLLSAEDVASFLGVDASALEAIRGRDGLDAAGEGYGHDMDQVLALQRKLAALLPLDQVDAVLGLKGLSSALLNLKLLTAVMLVDGMVVGVELESLALLLSRIQEKVDRRSSPVDGVQLATTTSDGTELPRIAWMVSQVLGGSLAAYAWPAPHRLMDLAVDRQRLSALARSPSGCEPVAGAAPESRAPEVLASR